jgi:isoleucyl-tRNA synthetase
LFCEGALFDVLTELGDELRFVLLSSDATVKGLSDGQASTAKPSDLEGLSLIVEASSKEKCERCWHHREDVGKSEVHPSLCGRCIENVDGEGEKRSFA